MPDTPIDLSDAVSSIRLKVPTGEVPIPPEGWGQLHSPAPGELALRLPDGSVVPVGGGGGGGGGAATALLGPGGAIEAGNSDPRIGITINAAPGTGIGFTGRFLDQFAKPLGVQVDVVPISSAELLELHNTPKELLPAPGIGKRYRVLAVDLAITPGDTPYVQATPLRAGSDVVVDGGDADFVDGGDFLTLAGPGWVSLLPTHSVETAEYAVLNRPYALGTTSAVTAGNGTVVVTTAYLVV